jgi:thioesterase domain-containing protein
VLYVPGTDEPLDWGAALQREMAYVPAPLSVPVVILGTEGYQRYAGSADLGWAPMLDASWEAELVPGNHNTMLGEPHVHVLADRLAAHIARVVTSG